MEPEEFLTYLWGPKPPGKILIWTMPDKLSYWFNRPAGVNALVKANRQKNFYASVALAPATLHVARRTKAHQTTAIPALWADVDFRHDVHKEPNLPPSAEAALETLQAMPDPPTMVIHSGHGLQAYWVLTTPWVFDSPMDRIKANTLTQYWHHRISLVFGAKGWSVDATHDLSRVMRLPGTTNFKQAPIAVTIVIQDGPRYQKDDLLELIPESFEANVDKTLWTRPPRSHQAYSRPTAPPPSQGRAHTAGRAYPAALHHTIPRGDAADAPAATPARDETPEDGTASPGHGANGPHSGQQLTGDSENCQMRVGAPEHPAAGDRTKPGPTRAAAGPHRRFQKRWWTTRRPGRPRGGTDPVRPQQQGRPATTAWAGRGFSPPRPPAGQPERGSGVQSGR